MIRSILIAYDGSPSSKSALSIASSIACLTDARLLGLFVQDQARFRHLSLSGAIAQSIGAQPNAEELLPPTEMLEAEEKVDEESKTLHAAFQSECETSRVRNRFLSVRGEPAKEIILTGRTVDLVVVGSCGKHTDVAKDKGATTNAVLRSTTRPVLVVPEEPEGASSAIIAYDGSPAAERVLRAAAELASVMQFEKVHLLTIGDDPDRARVIQQSAVYYLSHYNFKTEPELFRGSPDQVIVDYAEEIDTSVLALGAFGTNRIKERLFGSTTLAALQNTSCAVLLMG